MKKNFNLNSNSFNINNNSNNNTNIKSNTEIDQKSISTKSEKINGNFEKDSNENTKKISALSKYSMEMEYNPNNLKPYDANLPEAILKFDSKCGGRKNLNKMGIGFQPPKPKLNKDKEKTQSNNGSIDKDKDNLTNPTNNSQMDFTLYSNSNSNSSFPSKDKTKPNFNINENSRKNLIKTYANKNIPIFSAGDPFKDNFTKGKETALSNNNNNFPYIHDPFKQPFNNFNNNNSKSRDEKLIFRKDHFINLKN